MSPYRDPPRPQRKRWWRRLACALGRHEWSPLEQRYRYGIFQQCMHCEAALVHVPACPQLGTWVERGSLPPVDIAAASQEDSGP